VSAISDTGPLLLFSKLNRLELLPALYGEILVAEAVYFEAVTVGKQRNFPDAAVLEAFLAREGWQPVPAETVDTSVEGLSISIGRGEREAIALALHRSLPLLIDDSQARRFAHTLGIETKGSIGILVQAFRQSLLTAGELDQSLVTIEDREDIWMDPALCQRVRKQILG